MDIKAKIEEIIEKVKNDKSFGEKFKSDPVKAVESIVGVYLPDDTVKQIADGVKAKVNLDEIGSKLGGLGGIIDKIKN